MTTFYICRHGQTENNKSDRLSGWVDTPLTDEGLANIQSTAAKLQDIQFVSIHSSDLGRAFITAYLISRHLGYTAEVQRHKGLREENYGDVAGMLGDDAEAQYPGLHKDTNFAPPNGESLAQMQHRVLTILEVLSKQWPEQTVLLASHDGPINAIYASFANIDLGRLISSHVNPHDFVAKFTFDNGTITSFNEVLAAKPTN